MAKRFNSSGQGRLYDHQQLEKIQTGLKKLEETIRFEDRPCIHGTCTCLICDEKLKLNENKKTHYFDQSSEDAQKWLLTILNGLFVSHTNSLVLFIPDFLFVQGQLMQVFHTEPKENRVYKLAGVHPARSMYQVMIKLRKKYKWMLGEMYKKKLVKNLDPGFMHEKYLNNVIPTRLNKAQMIDHRQLSRNGEQTYVIHKNQKLADEAIEEHKLQDNESFCTVKFKSGNTQIFTKIQFESWMEMRNRGLVKSEEIVFVQAFIKQKQETQAFFVSSFTLDQNGVPVNSDFDLSFYDRAESQVLVLLGGISKYSSQYDDIRNFEQFTAELMQKDPKKYVALMTYKIVHYLGMVGRIYVKHLKINWIMNDIDQIYLQNILEFETIQISIKPLKYRLPPKEKDSMFYKDSENFIKLYQQVQMNNQTKRKKVREEFKKEVQHDFSMLSPFSSTISYTEDNIIKNKGLSSPKKIPLLGLRNKIYSISSPRKVAKSVRNVKMDEKSLQKSQYQHQNSFLYRRRNNSETKNAFNLY